MIAPDRTGICRVQLVAVGTNDLVDANMLVRKRFLKQGISIRPRHLPGPFGYGKSGQMHKEDSDLSDLHLHAHVSYSRWKHFGLFIISILLTTFFLAFSAAATLGAVVLAYRTPSSIPGVFSGILPFYISFLFSFYMTWQFFVHFRFSPSIHFTHHQSRNGDVTFEMRCVHTLLPFPLGCRCSGTVGCIAVVRHELGEIDDPSPLVKLIDYRLKKIYTVIMIGVMSEYFVLFSSESKEMCIKFTEELSARLELSCNSDFGVDISDNCVLKYIR